MLIDSDPEGKILTVYGWEDRPGQVHNEGTSLIGPKVVIDQLHNLAIVEGRGSLVMPASSDLSGSPLKKAEDIIVQFRDGMNFRGAQKVADFFGKVNASQGSSWVTCHTLQVNFDKPVYLSQANRPPSPKGADDKAKVDVVYCYPAPADSADGPHEKEVCYEQLDRDPASGRPIRMQRIVARELTLRAQARDPNGGEPYKLVFAEGPGTVRNWEPGAKDDGSGGPLGSSAGGERKGPPETEMKLTIVSFSGRMTAKDKGAIYKEATFIDPIETIHVPTDNPDLKIDRLRMPPRATLLTCSKELVVWSHKRAGEPTQQHMKAIGNAYILTEDYEGWGETITNDAKKVTFDDAGGQVSARIKGRYDGNDQSGKTIIYDSGTKHYEVKGGIGGTIMPAPRRPQPAPPKK
jgi:hypothetical protein